MLIIKNKIKIFTLSFLALIFIISGSVALFYLYMPKNIKANHLTDAINSNNKKKVKPSYFPYTYNYRRLLELMEEYRQFIIQFYRDYQTFMQTTKNKEQAINLLSRLKEERSLFKTYIKNLQKEQGPSLTRRKKKSISYHLHVIEEEISELEDILERFKEEIKNN